VGGLDDLASGETLQLYVGSYSDQDWVSAGAATVDSTGQLLSEDGGGLPLLSTLIVVRE
jgi:hypothetical protein